MTTNCFRCLPLTKLCVTVLAWLVAGACLWRAFSPDAPPATSAPLTSVSLKQSASFPHTLQAIQTIRVGQRVWVEENPTGEIDDRFGADVVPQHWRKMVMRSPKRTAGVAHVEMLRPKWWLSERDVRVGGEVDIEVPECGIQGLAEVLDIQPCPPIDGGPGRVVTAVFRHQAAETIDVAIEGLAKPIGTTSNHPFWNESEQQFVRADQLQPGDEVRTLNGIALVRSITPRGPPEPVYNLEVHVDHVYHVGETGVLVHNALEDCFKFARRVRDLDGGQVVRIDSPGQRHGAGIEVPGYSEPQLRHTFTVREGKVFDPIHPEGIAARDYFEQLRDLNGFSDIQQLKRFLGISKIE